MFPNRIWLVSILRGGLIGNHDWNQLKTCSCIAWPMLVQSKLDWNLAFQWRSVLKHMTLVFVCISFYVLGIWIGIPRGRMFARHIHSMSRVICYIHAVHAIHIYIHWGSSKLVTSVAPTFFIDNAKSGKGNGKGKWQRKCHKQTKMNASKKNSGFKKVNAELFYWVFDIDRDQHSLVPLAVSPSTNPVYAHKPGQGVVYEKILRDLSDSPDCDGIMAIGALDFGTICHKKLICAKVRLSIGEEGWINVAMRDNRWPKEEWLMYLKAVQINNPSFSEMS